MAGETGIAWTDATVNFVLGCTPIGDGCERCYAKGFVERKWPNIKFETGGRRHVTLSGFTDPPKWQRMHDRGQSTMRFNHKDAPIPVWIFACSLSDFFDNEWPDGVRDRAWQVIRACPSLRWILVTKRIGNVVKMLPTDWDRGRNYPHVGVVSTMVNQVEYDRDAEKLFNLYRHGVRWTGISMEPQLGPIKMNVPTDWVITGGESKQDDRPARPYDLAWAESLVKQCKLAGIPVFVKQMGDTPLSDGQLLKFKGKGDNIQAFPRHIRIQQMPRVFDDDPPRVAPIKSQSILL